MGHFIHGFVGKLELMSQVIYVPLEGVDLTNVVLLFVLHLPISEGDSVDLFFQLLDLHVEFLILLAHLVYAILESVIVYASIPVVVKNVFFLHFQSFQGLLGMSFPVGELFIFLLEEIVGLRGLGELRVDEFVFSCEGLDVLGQLIHLIVLDGRNLILFIELLPKLVDLLSELFYFILSFV